MSGIYYRYMYADRMYKAMGGQHGLRCNPVKDERGKCIVGRGSQMVTFEDGVMAIVIRRCLRLNKAQLELPLEEKRDERESMFHHGCSRVFKKT